jgi:hypothetical protein
MRTGPGDGFSREIVPDRGTTPTLRVDGASLIHLTNAHARKGVRGNSSTAATKFGSAAGEVANVDPRGGPRASARRNSQP